MFRYFLILKNQYDRYNFIEIFDKKDNLYYRIFNHKVEKESLLYFKDSLFPNKIPISDQKFNSILETKSIILNVDRESFLKMLNLHEWTI